MKRVKFTLVIDAAEDIAESVEQDIKAYAEEMWDGEVKIEKEE